jgi:hypothetical protein
MLYYYNKGKIMLYYQILFVYLQHIMAVEKKVGKGRKK